MVQLSFCAASHFFFLFYLFIFFVFRWFNILQTRYWNHVLLARIMGTHILSHLCGGFCFVFCILGSEIPFISYNDPELAFLYSFFFIIIFFFGLIIDAYFPQCNKGLHYNYLPTLPFWTVGLWLISLVCIHIYIWLL